MEKFLKKIYRKFLKRKKPNVLDIKPKEKKIVGLTLGKNTDIKGNISIRAKGAKVIIGDDCLIECLIAAETSNSKVKIGNNVYIGGGTIIDSACSIDIEDDVLISYQCIIQDSDNHNSSYSLRKK